MPAFRYTSRREFVAKNNLIVNVVIQILSSALVLITIFVGSWDCSTDGLKYCDTMLEYHVGMGNNESVSFSYTTAQNCEKT